jgi:type II secretory pathway pseudopilin PulG
MLFLVAVVSALLLPSPADARDWRRSGEFLQTQAQQADKDRDQYRRGNRDARRTERNGRNQGRGGRLTEKERRELHRDLDRARRDIYRRDQRR